MSMVSIRESLVMVTIHMVDLRLSDSSPGKASEGTSVVQSSLSRVPETRQGPRHQQLQTVTQASFYCPPLFQPQH